MTLHSSLFIILLVLLYPLQTRQELCTTNVKNYIESIGELIKTDHNAIDILDKYDELSEKIIDNGVKLMALIQKTAVDGIHKDDEEKKCIKDLHNLHKTKDKVRQIDNDLKQAGLDYYRIFSKLNVMEFLDEYSFLTINNLMYCVEMSTLFFTQPDSENSNFHGKIGDKLNSTCMSYSAAGYFFTNFYQYCDVLQNTMMLPQADMALNKVLNCALDNASNDYDPKFEHNRIKLLHLLQNSDKMEDDANWMCSMVKGNKTLAQSGKTEVVRFLRDVYWEKIHLTPGVNSHFCPASIALSLGKYSNETKQKLARIMLNTAALILDSELIVNTLYYSNEERIKNSITDSTNIILKRIFYLYQQAFQNITDDYYEMVLEDVKKMDKEKEHCYSNLSQLSFGAIFIALVGFYVM